MFEQDVCVYVSVCVCMCVRGSVLHDGETMSVTGTTMLLTLCVAMSANKMLFMLTMWSDGCLKLHKGNLCHEILWLLNCHSMKQKLGKLKLGYFGKLKQFETPSIVRYGAIVKTPPAGHGSHFTFHHCQLMYFASLLLNQTTIE